MSSQTWEDRIERVVSYIHDNVKDIETARDVAGVVDVSYETLRKRFRKEMGVHSAVLSTGPCSILFVLCATSVRWFLVGHALELVPENMSRGQLQCRLV